MTVKYVRHKTLRVVGSYKNSYYDSELGRMQTLVEILFPGEGGHRWFYTDDLESISLLEAMAFLAQ